MTERVIELSRSHAILWVFIDTGNCKRYAAVIRDQEDFFDAMAGSLFQGFCVITYLLFDSKRSDVKSLPSLISYLSSLNPALERQLKSNLDAQRPLLDKYFSFRHKIYAHRDKSKSPWELFGTVPKPRLKREMDAIVRLSRDTVCALSGAAGVRKRATMTQEIRRRENYARYDAKQVLEALEKNRL